jgi:uncharacterized protein
VTGAPDLSADEARRIAVAAQGFARPRPAGRAGLRDVRRVLARLHFLQIDSVAAVARSHYLPLQARLGDYRADTVDELAYDRRELFEYWGHAASFLRTELQPLLRWRMDPARASSNGLGKWARDRRDFVEDVHRRIAAEGPLGVGALGAEQRGSGWWEWSDGKTALEWLFLVGRVSVARRTNFARLYDLTERVLPAGVLAAPTPARVDAHRELLALAACALGVGTARDVADYFRLNATSARVLLDELVASGRLERVRVEGWKEPAYLDPAADAPRRVAARALLSPFDPLVFERRRTERIFGLRYRLEMYVPEPKRVHGYYVMPFLLGDALVARVDVRAVRAAGELHVPGAFLEPGRDARDVASALADELRVLARWLGLERIRVGRRGDLAAALRSEVASEMS